MDVAQALTMLRQALDAIPKLRGLDGYNNEFPFWRDNVYDILRTVFGTASDEYRLFDRAVTPDAGMSIWDYQKEYVGRVNNCESALNTILLKHGGATTPPRIEEHFKGPPNDSAEMPQLLFDRMQFHPKVVEASKSLFETGHYAQAIFEAFKAVNNLVKQKTGLDLDGKDLMAQVFNEKNPVLKLNPLKTRSDKDEQEGFKFLFMGAMVGIRNPKAHENIVHTDPYRTLEYLGFASLLMKVVELGAAVREGKAWPKSLKSSS